MKRGVKNKMEWKEWPSWLKGGIIFGLLMVILSFTIPLLFNTILGKFLISIIYIPFIVFPLRIFSELFFSQNSQGLFANTLGIFFRTPSILGFIIIFIIYFIIGAIIGWIVGKIKKK